MVADGLEPRDILWQPPTALPESINTPAEDYEPRVSYTGDELFFVRGKAGSNADIYRCVRDGEVWSEPEALSAINTPVDELGPTLSRDGQALYFYSDREGGVGGYDLWVAHRGSSGWQTPINLGPRINTTFNEYGPALTPDGAWLYFSSNRPRANEAAPEPQAWPATLREDRYVGDYDIYLAARDSRDQ